MLVLRLKEGAAALPWHFSRSRFDALGVVPLVVSGVLECGLAVVAACFLAAKSFYRVAERLTWRCNQQLDHIHGLLLVPQYANETRLSSLTNRSQYLASHYKLDHILGTNTRCMSTYLALEHLRRAYKT